MFIIKPIALYMLLPVYHRYLEILPFVRAATREGSTRDHPR